MLRFFRFCLLLILALLALSSESLACSCGNPIRLDVTLDQVRKEKREYFLNEFRGAAFIGKIVKRERVRLNWIATSVAGEPVALEFFKYTIRVSDHWFGVNSKSVVVFGEPDEPSDRSQGTTSCGFKLNEGKTYFFTPHLYKNSLEIELCDYAGGGSEPSGNRAVEFRKIVGEPKRFR